MLKMKISVSDLQTERQWRSATGLDKARFYNLLPKFEKAYIEIYGKTLKERLVENNVNYCIHNEEELLLFTLLSFKSGLTYDLLGLVCGTDGSNAERNQKTGLKILMKSLESSGHAPKRNFMNINDFKEYFADADTLKIDATEQRIQRPSDKEKQKDYYSGKKRLIRQSQ